MVGIMEDEKKMFMDEIENAAADLEEKAEAVQESVEEAAAAVEETAADAVEEASEAAEDTVADAVEESAEAAEAVEDAIDAAADTAEEAAETAEEAVAECAETAEEAVAECADAVEETAADAVEETAEAVERLCQAYNDICNSGQYDPLLMIPVFILDFLCIHPFNDGNGRMSRLLTLLLLYRAGYNVGKFISIEKLIEETKEVYYDEYAPELKDYVYGLPNFLGTIFIITMIVGMVLVVIAGGREEKSFGAKAGQGLYNLYGITGYVGDLVSYTRLMALGLAGGSIAGALNLLIHTLPGVAAVLLGPILFVLFHIFNLGLSLLGAYVHTARLQYVEYFGKFYDGGGKPFKAFKGSEKYIRIKRN